MNEQFMEWFEQLLTDAEYHEDKLNDWEKGFMKDWREKFDERGENIKVTDRQEEFLVRIRSKLNRYT